MEIDRFATLIQHEAEIIRRINALPNGGALFMIHPFRTLEDVGVKLSAQARAEILRIKPELGALSSTPYEAMKASRAKQSYTVNLTGLFQHRKPKGVNDESAR